ncbi:I78 family peptidase inhibitor [Brucella cytisi]|uniref:I78 family peptidase inhibitor n=1 Tax=Brucella cytisi TaxID=407152 RepID=UPI00313D3CF7
MNFIRTAVPVAGVALMLVIAGCQKEKETSVAADTLQPRVCKKEAAETLAGKDRISDEVAMKLTGATIVRQIKPGDPVTMDLRQERVTIETDQATGKIVRAFCG